MPLCISDPGGSIDPELPAQSGGRAGKRRESGSVPSTERIASYDSIELVRFHHLRIA